MSKGVQVIGIDTWNGSTTQVSNFAASAGATFPIGINGNAVGADWGFSHNSFAIIDKNIIRFVTSQAGSYSQYFDRDVDDMKAVLDALTQSMAIYPAPGARSANYALNQAAPNPFGGHTRIKYSIGPGSSSERYSLTVFDILGREIRSIVDSALPVGNYTALWDGHDGENRQVPSGIYFIVLANGKTAAQVLPITYLRNGP